MHTFIRSTLAKSIMYAVRRRQVGERDVGALLHFLRLSYTLGAGFSSWIQGAPRGGESLSFNLLHFGNRRTVSVRTKYGALWSCISHVRNCSTMYFKLLHYVFEQWGYGSNTNGKYQYFAATATATAAAALLHGSRILKRGNQSLGSLTTYAVAICTKGKDVHLVPEVRHNSTNK